ncbi:MAG TPA: DUF1553 domain-containing protein [Isosphaeraceae bacterium]|nr:DUF1553 domain-containing protein [Isosphaeraceae bacterium]
MRWNCPTAGLVAIGLALAVAPRTTAAPPATEAKETHWAFQPVRRPGLPAVSDPAWSGNPIDRFIRARMDAEGVKPVGEADRPTLIRRLSLDLIGLPPTPDEVRAFVQDSSPDAVAKVVDDLLARPQYGERWARHWLDVVRYAETNGYERDGDKPHAWRYRDYVIQALNRDLPYNRFLIEQLAGDEVEGSDAAAQIATTFLRLGTWDDEPADPVVDRYDQLDDVLGTAATAFLGITLRCARCHDHKFEPFSQVDYYRMLAVFQPLKRPQDDRADLDRPVGTEAELAAYHAGLARADAEFTRIWERIEALIRPELDRLLAPRERSKNGQAPRKRTSLPPAVVKALQTPSSKRSPAQWTLVKDSAAQIVAEARAIAPEEVKAALRPLDDRIAAIKAAQPRELPRAYIWYEDGPKAPVTRILKRGDPTRPGAAVEPGVPAVLAAQPTDPPRPTARSTGRRLWLARWLTRPENPLVSRVIVNRIWQFHFGEGLVASSNDFGVMGDAPSHPELLDWLAAELVASGWRLKPLHRLIVLSRTYQRSSAFEPAADRVDPKGTLLWRWRPRRLEAEVVRDSILAVSGQLNLRMGGPGVYPTLPRAVLEGQSQPGKGWGQSDERERSRRSIYIFAKRSLAVPELELLDTPDTTGSCERRIVSTTGPQALTFLNGAFIHEQARHFAARLIAEAGPRPKDQVDRAFALALGRPPRTEESQAALEFLDRQTQQIQADAAPSPLAPGAARRKALEAFCLVVLNMNDFVYN